jgi:RNA ligase (TIGR02306 family)
MRKLATIRKISKIQPIEGADTIECAIVDGWHTVIKKGEFKPGDLAIYIEIDSWIPHELAPFLSKGQKPREYEGVKGELLRTVTLRGQISQGLLLPLHIAGNEGDDVTETLGIKKWEPTIPAQLAGQIRGKFPSRVPKTDQERVQNLKESDLANHSPYEITEKLDGTSCTWYLDLEEDFHVCGRNMDFKRDDCNTMWRLAEQYGIEAKMKQLKLAGTAIQGEIIGHDIQENHYKLRGQKFFTFDIYDVKKGRYLTPTERNHLLEKLELNPVPLLATTQTCTSIDDALNIAQGNSKLVQKEREGVVFKTTNENRFSFKAISNRFLLKGN